VGLPIVRWCLSRAGIAGVEYEQFESLVFPGGRLKPTQKARLKSIWSEAAHSIGCQVGETLGFESHMMVEWLKRYALYEAALIASTRNQIFVMYYTNRLHGRAKERGIKTKMRVKLAAKLLIIAWTLMKREEPFNPEFLNTG
jgi:hypothetical protein